MIKLIDLPRNKRKKEFIDKIETIVDLLISNSNQLGKGFISISTQELSYLWKDLEYKDLANKDMLEEICDAYRYEGYDVEVQEINDNNYVIQIEIPDQGLII